MIRRRQAWAFGMLVIALSIVGQGLAAPSHEDPDAPLAVRAEKPNAELAAKADGLYREAVKSLGELEEKITGKQLKLIKPAVIGQVHVQILQLRRLAEHLIVLGEPAGIDFRYRAGELDQRIGVVVGVYLKLPGMSDRIVRERAVVDREAEKRRPAIAKAKQLLDRQQYEQADTVLSEATDAVESLALWYDRDERRAILGKFWDVQVQIDRPLKAQREKENIDALAQLRTAKSPDFFKLLGDIHEATVTLRGSGKAKDGDELLDGPSLLARFAERWQESQHAALVCRAIDLSGLSKTNRPEVNQLAAEQAKFSVEIVPALVGLIEADIAHATPADAAVLYQKYVETLAPLVPLTADETLRKSASAALETLAAKSPSLAADVAAYRKVTAGVLHWRRRLAQAENRLHSSKYPDLPAVFLASAKATNEWPGLVPLGMNEALVAHLSSSAPVVMRPMAKKLVGQKVTVSSLFQAGTSKMTFSRYQARSIAGFTLPEALKAEVADLENDLLVNDAAAPLTLDAAVALATARRGDLLSAGGTIQGTFLEGMVTRFVTLPTAARTLVALGPMPTEYVGDDPLAQVLVRFDLKPEWIRHECFFLELAKGPESRE